LEKRLKIIGYIAVTLGLVSAVLCYFPFGMFFGIFTGFLGMIVSSVYIFIDTKNEINTHRFTAGIFGMILSSLPVLFMMIWIFRMKSS
jgi:hypothetical protein